MKADRRPPNGVRQIPPTWWPTDGAKHLPGVLNLLADTGYDDEAALRWSMARRPSRRTGRPPSATRREVAAPSLGF
jgi:hypothetical protein